VKLEITESNSARAVWVLTLREQHRTQQPQLQILHRQRVASQRECAATGCRSWHPELKPVEKAERGVGGDGAQQRFEVLRLRIDDGIVGRRSSRHRSIVRTSFALQANVSFCGQKQITPQY
jgi:hypothetical protein